MLIYDNAWFYRFVLVVVSENTNHVLHLCVCACACVRACALEVNADKTRYMVMSQSECSTKLQYEN